MKRKRLISLIFSLVILSLQAQFVISPGSTLTIKDGGSVFINTNFFIQSNATASGYLVDQTGSGECEVTGSISIERFLSANAWHNTSSPVSNAGSSVYAGTELVFYYDESIIENNWNFGWVMYQGPLQPMKGYDVYLSGTDLTAVYSGNGTAALNTGSYSINVYKTDPANGEIESHKGWNLLGNPYPSPLDWQKSSAWNKSHINDAKYIWDHQNNNYTIWLGGTNPVGLNGGTQYIPSNQGFWVQAVQNGSVSVNNDARVGQTPSTPDYYKDAEIDYPLLRLEVGGNSFYDESIIRFIEGASTRFDRDLDAAKLFSRVEKVPQLWSRTANYNFGINSLPAIENDLVVSLYFNCSESGYYSIKMTDCLNIPDTVGVWLKDHKRKRMLHIMPGQAYDFYHDSREDNQRFSLYFNPSERSLNDFSNSFARIYVTGNQVNIINNTTDQLKGELMICNVQGQLVFEQAVQFERHREIPVYLESGCYIIRLISVNGICSTKACW